MSILPEETPAVIRFAAGIFFLAWIFYPILGFNGDVYQGPMKKDEPAPADPGNPIG